MILNIICVSEWQICMQNFPKYILIKYKKLQKLRISVIVTFPYQPNKKGRLHTSPKIHWKSPFQPHAISNHLILSFALICVSSSRRTSTGAAWSSFLILLICWRCYLAAIRLRNQKKLSFWALARFS